ncbi:NnrS family protein [Marinicella rhabdoformis]|uniref:NnrS family protein n=1 Tax=Marinicella rhabdoformis TaxID=2580566 RepID=UPI0012AEC8DD|nr:NnrS family protein [Marinicella rhabdoformis]
MNIPLNDLNAKASVKGLAIWQLGFRPFFFCASLYAVVTMLLWLGIRHGLHFPGLNYYGINLWHAHEMVFGYGLAVIAGFLLTAIKNWTGVPTASHRHLKMLVLLWLLGRVVAFVPAVPNLVIAVVDVLFGVVLTFYVAHPLVKVGNKRNYKMIVLVALFFTMNLMTHVMLLSQQPLYAMQMTGTALFLMLLLIGVMAGRVFPMFSQNGVTEHYKAKSYPWVEKLWPPVMIAFVVTINWFRLTEWGTWLLLALSLVSFGLHAARLMGWYNHQIWQKPLVWVLHVAYGFLVLGFAATAVSVFKPFGYFLALHLFTVGCLAMVTLGMMARVSFGHTGRNLHQPPQVLFWSFSLLVASTVIRVLFPAFKLMSYQAVIDLSGGLWVLAFGLFFIRYTGIWLKPRVDGQPG